MSEEPFWFPVFYSFWINGSFRTATADDTTKCGWSWLKAQQVRVRTQKKLAAAAGREGTFCSAWENSHDAWQPMGWLRRVIHCALGKTRDYFIIMVNKSEVGVWFRVRASPMKFAHIQGWHWNCQSLAGHSIHFLEQEIWVWGSWHVRWTQPTPHDSWTSCTQNNPYQTYIIYKLLCQNDSLHQWFRTEHHVGIVYSSRFWGVRVQAAANTKQSN